MSFYVSNAIFSFLLHCDEWDRVVALPRHKFVTGATLLQLKKLLSKDSAHLGIIFIYVLRVGRKRWHSLVWWRPSWFCYHILYCYLFVLYYLNRGYTCMYSCGFWITEPYIYTEIQLHVYKTENPHVSKVCLWIKKIYKFTNFK